MKLTFEGQTAEELHAHILRFAEVFGLKKTANLNADGVEECDDLKPAGVPPLEEIYGKPPLPSPAQVRAEIRQEVEPHPDPRPTPKTKSPQRLRKIRVVIPASDKSSGEDSDEDLIPEGVTPPENIKKPEMSEYVSSPEVLSGIPTKDEVLEALQYLCTNKNQEAARKLLSSFGAARISELKEENYVEFVTECRKQN